MPWALKGMLKSREALADSSIYAELGQGERLPLTKLAVEHLERHGRPFRIAVDISIWTYQVQSGKGGENPALRVLYYRLVNLLSLAIQPVFVFDGGARPPFKRDKNISGSDETLLLFQAKQFIRAFGFPIVEAPGEAEAECALLQKHGIVDAVLTEDVDVLMFGSSVSLRNFSREGSTKSRSLKVNYHVTTYRLQDIAAEKQLTPEGMILVAMMSGGDYIPAGIPRCGPKIAIEAARAGFGKDLCSLAPGDALGLREWRSRLEHELHTNESKFFRTKHMKLAVPEDFPNEVVLGYYTHPAVSSDDVIERLKKDIDWNRDVDLIKLRNLVAKDFSWKYRSGARKLIRTLAPALLVQKLRTGKIGPEAILNVHSKRQHAETPDLTEIRVEFTPREMMSVDLEAEAEELVDLAVLDDEDMEHESAEANSEQEIAEPIIKRKSASFNPSQPQRVWIPETIFRLGASQILDGWELRNKDKPPPKKQAKKKSANGGMQYGALHPFLTTSKPGISAKPTKPHFRDQSFRASQSNTPPTQSFRVTNKPATHFRCSPKQVQTPHIWESQTCPASEDEWSSPSLPSPSDLLRRLRVEHTRDGVEISSSPFSFG